MPLCNEHCSPTAAPCRAAIDFYCTVDKVQGKHGENRVVITFNGKVGARKHCRAFPAGAPLRTERLLGLGDWRAHSLQRALPPAPLPCCCPSLCTRLCSRCPCLPWCCPAQSLTGTCRTLPPQFLPHVEQLSEDNTAATGGK